MEQRSGEDCDAGRRRPVCMRVPLTPSANPTPQAHICVSCPGPAVAGASSAWAACRQRPRVRSAAREGQDQASMSLELDGNVEVLGPEQSVGARFPAWPSAAVPGRGLVHSPRLVEGHVNRTAPCPNDVPKSPSQLAHFASRAGPQRCPLLGLGPVAVLNLPRGIAPPGVDTVCASPR